MDKKIGNKGPKSLISNTKNIGVLLGWSFVIVYLIGCQTGGKKGFQLKPHPKPPKDYVPAQVKQLTFEGENREPQYSHDMSKMIYVSAKRKRHEHTQIYIFDFSTKAEKRITYQDGTNSTPIFDVTGLKIFYASSTDEIKERPTLIHNAINNNANNVDTSENSAKVEDNNESVKKYNISTGQKFFNVFPAEIYSSLPNGNKIRRLTQRPDFDGSPSLSYKNKVLLFSSRRHGDLNLFKMTTNGKNLQQITTSPEHELQGQFSPDGARLAWISIDEKFLYSKLVVADASGSNAQELTSGVNYVLSPSWHSSGNYLLFSANLDEYDNFELYIYDFIAKCIKRLTYLSSNEMDPAFSPDGKGMLFSSNLSGSPQIYFMAFLPPSSCVP